MVLNNDQDLPAELLKKLEGLQIELEDGDITQKGYDKKRTTLLEQHTQQKKEEEEALLASLGPEPSAADVIDFLDYLPSPTHSPPRPSSGEQYMEQNHQGQQHSSSSTSATVSTSRVSSISNHSNSNQMKYPTTDPYQQRQQQQWQQQQQQQQQQHSYGQPQQTQQPPVGYPAENTMPSGQYYPSNMVSGSPRPNRPYDPRMVRPQYAPQPQQYYTSQPHTNPGTAARPLPSTPMYQQQQRPMPFPGSSHPQQQSQQQRPMYPNQPRPMYRPGASPSMMNGNMQRHPTNGTSGGGGGVYYRPGPPPSGATPQGYPPPVYPVQGRSPTLDQQRAPYGYNGGVSRSSSHGRYSS